MDKSGAAADDVESGDYEHERTGTVRGTISVLLLLYFPLLDPCFVRGEIQGFPAGHLCAFVHGD
jgi:hypothetical protein